MNGSRHAPSSGCAGPTEQFGMPGPGVTLEQKRRYPDVIDTFGQPHYDAVLVDGRCGSLGTFAVENLVLCWFW